MGTKNFIAILVVLAAAFIGVLVFSGKKSTETGGQGEQSAQTSQHVLGNTESAVTFTEYGDFQCPACLRYEPVMLEIREKYKDQIAFQFRNFPLVQIHPNAMAAHRAAEAAGKQGKFWEMHDLLYQNQQQWSGLSSASSTFENYAQQLDLDMEQYGKDVASAEVNDIIQADIKAGHQIGANSTPTFAINGEIIDTPEPNIEAFSQIIDDKLRSANQQ
jgi:protein-disulfide isomerase